MQAWKMVGDQKIIWLHITTKTQIDEWNDQQYSHTTKTLWTISEQKNPQSRSQHTHVTIQCRFISQHPYFLFYFTCYRTIRTIYVWLSLSLALTHKFIKDVKKLLSDAQFPHTFACDIHKWWYLENTHCWNKYGQFKIILECFIVLREREREKRRVWQKKQEAIEPLCRKS